MSIAFHEQVSAVTPLDGDAIDGTPRPKPKRSRKPAREPMDRSLTFFCSNPQCDHGTWSPVEQARHMAREFWEVAQALVALVPESAEALKLTGGVILRDLSDDELREASRLYGRYWRRGLPIPTDIRLRECEYSRRVRTGELTLLSDRSEWQRPQRDQREVCLKGHDLTPENTYLHPNGQRECRRCQRARKRKYYHDGNQRERERQQKRRADIRELHNAGDHSRCWPSRCKAENGP